MRQLVADGRRAAASCGDYNMEPGEWPEGLLHGMGLSIATPRGVRGTCHAGGRGAAARRQGRLRQARLHGPGGDGVGKAGGAQPAKTAVIAHT